jgi:hypothetical protein
MNLDICIRCEIITTVKVLDVYVTSQSFLMALGILSFFGGWVFVPRKVFKFLRT